MSDFHSALQSVFGRLDWWPIADGGIQRFHAPGDRPGSKNGWYLVFSGDISAGCFGSWKTGVTTYWSSRTTGVPLEHALMRERIDQARRKGETERLQRQASVAASARQLWDAAVSADPHHPYLLEKQCPPTGLRQCENWLLVPLFLGGEIVSMQRIGPNGKKLFLAGGRTTGAAAMLGTINAGEPLYICEGWATGSTIHAATGAAVACAMSANNLLEVGTHLRNQHPNSILIVAGDDDRQTEGNPGRRLAQIAAQKLGCGLVFPPWPVDAPLHLTDFNDLRQWQEAGI
ncbi:toprim domain-containing protein [Pseudomonas sp. TMP9]|uniref:toprim domain-containing protein n=1 Tax=Pseudomonas sp. TMP9 TaxID=3133144 RepID=UPI0030D32D81